MSTDYLQRQIADRNWSRNELARRMNIDRRTIAKWFEDGEVPSKYERQVRAALGPAIDVLRSLSDTALIAELARRLAERDEHNGPIQGKQDPPHESSPGVSLDPARTSVQAAAGPPKTPRTPRQR